MTENHRSFRAMRAVAPALLVLAAACQATSQADVARTPAAVAAPAEHQHTPGMVMEPARRDTGMMHQMDADVRFMHHMTMHHVQALEMTSLVPSRNPSRGLGLLSERMDVSQKDEIALMRRWLERRGKPLPPPGDHMMPMAMPEMLTDAEMALLRAATGSGFERLFLELMIKHHVGALAMVAELLGSQEAAQDSELFALVSGIESDQRAEIARMQSMLSGMGPRPPG